MKDPSSGADLGDLLDGGDVWGVAQLTYLRNRSLANPHWKRDADRIRYRLTKRDPEHGPTWTTPSPLDLELADALAALGAYEASLDKGRRSSDSSWAALLVAIDRLIERGNELNGRRIRGWA